MSEQIPVADKLEKKHKKGPGSKLKNAREAKGLSIEIVAAKLFLTKSVIEAIEADDYSSTPGVAFMRGYLRSYANYVGENPTGIIKEFDGLGLEDQPANMPTQRIYHKNIDHFGKGTRRFAYIGAVVIVGIIILWWHNASQSSTTQTQVATQNSDLTPTVNLPVSTITLNDKGNNITTAASPEIKSKKHATHKKGNV